VLDRSLWQPLQRYRRTASVGAYEELVLVMAYLAAEDPDLWVRMVAARPASVRY
jgi:hypothetical protein